MATQSMTRNDRIINVNAPYTVNNRLNMRTIIRVLTAGTVTLVSEAAYVGFEVIIVNASAGVITLATDGVINAKALTLADQWAATTAVVTSISNSHVATWDAYGELS